jgi:hypothetical protein
MDASATPRERKPPVPPRPPIAYKPSIEKKTATTLMHDDKWSSEASPPPPLIRKLDCWLQLRRDAYGSPAEVLMFVAFLIALTGVAFSSAYGGQQHSEFHGALLDFFKVPHFQDVEAIYDWMEGPLFESLLPTGAFGHGSFRDDKLQLISHVQQRQLRVSATDCAAVAAAVSAGLGSSITSLEPEQVTMCYPAFSSKAEAKISLLMHTNRSFPPTQIFSGTDKQSINVTSRVEWRQKAGTTIVGASGRVYPNTGFVVRLALERAEAEYQMAVLRNNGWLGPYTRALFLDFLVYSPVHRTIGTVTQVVEIPPTGKISTSLHVRTAPLHFLVAEEGPSAVFYKYAGLEGEIVLVTWTTMYLVREIYVIARIKWWYILGKGRTWRALDWALWILIFAAFRCRLTVYEIMGACQEIPRRAADFQGCTKEIPLPPMPKMDFPDYTKAMEPLMSYRALTALSVAGHWIKVLRYMHKMTICRAVIAGFGHVMWTLVVLAVFLCILMAAIAQGLVLVLGVHSSDFSSISSSFSTLYLALLCSSSGGVGGQGGGGGIGALGSANGESRQEGVPSVYDPSGVGRVLLLAWRVMATLLLPPIISALVVKGMLASQDSGVCWMLRMRVWHVLYGMCSLSMHTMNLCGHGHASITRLWCVVCRCK